MIGVSSVTVCPQQITIKKGEWYYGITVTVCPEYATLKSVKWYSDNPNVATVNEFSGYVYAKAAGTTLIYAVAVDGSGARGYATVNVTDAGDVIKVSSVFLHPDSLLLREKECSSLDVTVLPSNAKNKSVSWKSDDQMIAFVNGGDVYGVSEGCTYVTATANDGSGVSARCRVQVVKKNYIPLEAIKVIPDKYTLRWATSVYLRAVFCPADADDKVIKWISMDPEIATVNPNDPLVYAKKVGTARIRAVSTNGSGIFGECIITVIDPVYAECIELSQNSIELYKGGTTKLCATVLPLNATKKKVTWSSMDTNIVTVDELNGDVAAVGVGKTKICATSFDGKVKDYCDVTVKQTAVSPAESEDKPILNDGLVADPVDAYSGAHMINNNIITLFGGQGLGFTASYDSTKLTSGTLGTGWYHNYEKHLEIAEDGILIYSNPSVYSRYVSNGEENVYYCTSVNKGGYVLQVDCPAEYPYIVDCNSERKEFYNNDGYLSKIINHNGFETLIDYSENLITVTDSVSGKKIYIEKDLSGKIIKVYDDAARKASFTYEGDLLKSICDVNGNSITYTYTPEGLIKSGTDANNVKYFENTYDVYGRVISQKDGIPGSNPTTFVYESDGKRITTDRNGKQSIRMYDENGLLSSVTDANGNAKTYEYDACYNVVKETDAKGNSVLKTYNIFNKPTEITDKNGKKTTFTYDSKGNITKITYPVNEGKTPVETFEYNDRNQIVKHTDLRGMATVYTYDSHSLPATQKTGSRNAVRYSYSNGLLMSETDAMNNTILYGYNDIGQLVSRKDAENNVTSYEYDAIGNLIKATDANGKSVVNEYDCNNQKIAVTDANGNKTEYSYNGNMKNDVVTMPDGNTVQYEFDGEDRPVKITDQAGNVTALTYDPAGRIVSKRLPDGAVLKYEYDSAGNVVKEINPLGAATVKTYDKNGNVLSVTDNEGNITRYQYNAMSKVTRAVNAVSGATVYSYSSAGDLLSETDALNNKKTYTYDIYGNMLTSKDARGNITRYTYDANNNLLTVKDPLNNVTTYTYNSLNQLVSVKDARNNVVKYGYDALGRRTTVTDAKNNVFTTVYDANGNVVKTTDAKGNTISETVYNSLNLPISVTDAAGKTTSYTYNALGKVASVTDSMNNRKEYTYNSRGQNTSVKDALNNSGSADYNVLGNITKLCGPLGGSTSYTYDDMGRLVEETTSSGGAVSYTYNELNVKKQLTNGRGQNRKYFYDVLGRITSCVSEEDSVGYTYDANGNVLTVTGSNGVITRAYDALNRVISYTDTYGYTINYTYDPVGNLTQIVYPDNTAVNYAYDANNNLISVTDWENRITSYTYDENNNVTGSVKPDGSVTTTVYDNKHRVTSTVERTVGGDVITGYEYVYDTLSRITEEKDLAKNVKMCYIYDKLSRLTKRTVKNFANVTLSEETYSYDAAGNITGDKEDNSFVYDADNRLLSYNGKTISYDMDGNMLTSIIEDEPMDFEYDSANRLLYAGGQNYTYDAEDNRIFNVRECYETLYTYNTNCKLSQLLQKMTNGIVTKYVYGLGLIGEEKFGEFKTYHYDYRGSTVAITDESGAVTDTFEYDSYGKLINRTGESFVIFGYNGRDGVITDANGLLYMRARYYSPELRRFINADIVPGEISDSTSLNRYAYVNGNPVSYVDPFGLKGFLSGLWNSVKKVAKGIKKAVVGIRELIKNPEYWSLYMANGFLYLEDILSEIKNAGVLRSDRYNPVNYVYNRKHDKVGHSTADLIDSQGYGEKTDYLRIGVSTVGYSGCEAIAVYNAKILLGHSDVSLAKVIADFEEEGAVVLQESVINGLLGGNPYSMSRVLERNGLQYSSIDSFNDIEEPGIYIVSFWNTHWVGGELHTITIEVKENGEVQCYNYGTPTTYDTNNKDINELKNMSNMQFISGFKLESPNEKAGRK